MFDISYKYKLKLSSLVVYLYMSRQLNSRGLYKIMH